MQIKTLVAAFACAFASVAASAGSLSTSFSTNNAGRYGMYFDLTAASSAVTIDSFTVNGGTGEWSIYYKTGTYAGFETNPSAWTLLGSDTTSQTVDTLQIGGVTIGAGQTDAFYVFDFGGYQNYSNGITSFSNDDLTFNGIALLLLVDGGLRWGRARPGVAADTNGGDALSVPRAA